MIDFFSLSFGCESVLTTMNAPLAKWDADYGYRSTTLPHPTPTASSSWPPGVHRDESPSAFAVH